jgi:nucleosome binding factor SPN SPT16 subunit
LQDKPEGKLGDLWTAEFERSGLPTTDVSVGVGNLFSTKDAQEQICAKKSGLLAASAMKNYVVNQLEGVPLQDSM